MLSLHFHAFRNVIQQEMTETSHQTFHDAFMNSTSLSKFERDFPKIRWRVQEDKYYFTSMFMESDQWYVNAKCTDMLMIGSPVQSLQGINECLGLTFK
jgi:hypothetical protein